MKHRRVENKTTATLIRYINNLYKSENQKTFIQSFYFTCKNIWVPQNLSCKYHKQMKETGQEASGWTVNKDLQLLGEKKSSFYSFVFFT